MRKNKLLFVFSFFGLVLLFNLSIVFSSNDSPYPVNLKSIFSMAYATDGEGSNYCIDLECKRKRCSNYNNYTSCDLSGNLLRCYYKEDCQ